MGKPCYRDSAGRPTAWRDPDSDSGYIDAWNGFYPDLAALMSECRYWTAAESARVLEYGSGLRSELELESEELECDLPVIDGAGAEYVGVCDDHGLPVYRSRFAGTVYHASDDSAPDWSALSDGRAVGDDLTEFRRGYWDARHGFAFLGDPDPDLPYDDGYRNGLEQ